MQTRLLLLSLLFSFGIAAVSRADDRKPYTMADLRTLGQQKAWSELIDHLEDIPPSGRDTEWRGLVQQAGLGALTVAGQKGPFDGIFLSEGLLRRYPALKEGKDFMTKRGELGLQAFARCFDKEYWSEACGERLKPFVEADPTNGELAFRLGKLLPPRLHRWIAVPAFAVAIQKKDDRRCADSDVSRAVISGLHLSKTGNEDVVNQSILLASNLCWKALEPAVREAMGDDSSDYLSNTCPFVKTKGALSPLLTKRCEAVAKAQSKG